MKTNHNRKRGYTLIELMLGIAIASILGTLAIGGISDAVEASRASEAKAQLLDSIMRGSVYAGMNEAHVVLCPSSNQRTCSVGRDWTQGWIAFGDMNLDRERSPNEVSVGGFPALKGKVRLTTTPGRTRMVFQPTGGNAGSNITFTLCDGRGPNKAVTIVANNQGRYRFGVPNAAGILATCQGGDPS